VKSKIRIDPLQVAGEVNPMIFGQFIEHMGRAIYGGVYEPGNPLSDEAGFRLDVIEKIKELNPPILRWPGGNFVSGYHWLDGVGPKEERPRRYDRAWRTVETNQFGTHDFVALCRRVGTEPYICVNLGWGTPEEAVNWLEYCNMDAGTYYGDLRRQNGAAEPFNVKYWGLGNEIYGTWQHGHCEPQEYAHKAAETAKMMKRVDPQAEFIFCGANRPDWDRRTLDYLYRKGYAQLVDYVSLHRYDGCPTYYGALLATADFETDIRALEGTIDAFAKQYRLERLPAISVDEWNIWYRRTGDREVGSRFFREGEDLLDELYNLRDAIYIASVLNMFIRHADRVKMANLAQLVNVIAPIFATPKGSYYQPIFFPLKFFRQMHKELALDVNVESETLNITRDLEQSQHKKYADEISRRWDRIGRGPQWPDYWFGRQFSLLDVAATRSADGREIVISLVNRDEQDPGEVEIDLWDFKPRSGRRLTITGPDPMGYMLTPSGPTISDNDYNEAACTVTQSDLHKVAAKFTIELPAHSIAILTLGM